MDPFQTAINEKSSIKPKAPELLARFQMPCKGFCNYHPFKLTHRADYSNDSYHCNVCKMDFMKETGSRCPCCRQTMRSRGRDHALEFVPLEQRQNASIIEIRQGFLASKTEIRARCLSLIDLYNDNNS